MARRKRTSITFPTNGTIRFVRGQTNATITVRILDDNIFEGLETFTVALSNPTAARRLARAQPRR